MPRPSSQLRAAVCLLALLAPAAAEAAPQFTPAERVIARASAVSSASGTITAVGGSALTIQTSGRRVGAMDAMIAAADRLTRADYNYVWGGGHPAAGIPTRSGHKLGFDCSGSVAAVLVAGGLWPAGSPVPSDAGVISQLRQEGLILSGSGSGATDLTLYDDPGYHIFMRLAGRYFGTSDGGGSDTANGGPGWLDDGAPDTQSRAYHAYHVLPSALRYLPGTSQTLTFGASAASLLAGFAPGDAVTVTYAAGSRGAMTATGVSFTGAATASGSLVSIGSGGATITLKTTGGQRLSLTLGSGLRSASLVPGDTLEVLYTHTGATYLARRITVTEAPLPTGAAAVSGGTLPGGGTSGGTGFSMAAATQGNAS